MREGGKVMEDDIRVLIDAHKSLKQELKEIESRLVAEIISYKGSILDALRSGIIKPNVPVPSNFNSLIAKGREK